MVKNTCISDHTGDSDTFSGLFRPSKDAFSKFSSDFQKTYTCKQPPHPTWDAINRDVVSPGDRALRPSMLRIALQKSCARPTPHGRRRWPPVSVNARFVFT